MFSFRPAFTAASVECDPASRLFKPSAAFEVRNGLMGIAKHYNYPHSLSASQFEASLTYNRAIYDSYRNPNECNFRIEPVADIPQDALSRLQTDWYDLRRLNPDLAPLNIPGNDPYLTLQAVNGAACMLNASDITLYIETIHLSRSASVMRTLLQDDVYAALFSELTAHAVDNYIGWVPSIDTMEDVIDGFRQRGNVAPAL